jgi:hypothetical protein
MGFKLNLTNDEIKNAQGNFEPVPAGTYGAQIFESVQKKSKAGNQMFEINYKLTEGPAGKGRKIKSWYVLSGKGLFKLVELNKATDFPYPDKNTPAGEFEFPDADEYLGKEVNLVLDVEDYASVDDDGNDTTRQRNVVKRVAAYDPDKITTAEDLEGADEDESLFL